MNLDFHLIAQLPIRGRVRRIWGINLPRRALEIMIFIFKFGGLSAQFIAAVVLVNEANSPKVYIPLGLLAFILGVMEGGLTLLRA